MLCMDGAHTSAAPEPSAGRAMPQRSPREGSRVSRLCWPGRINQAHMYVDVRNAFIVTYLSFRKASPENRVALSFIQGV